MRSSEESDIEPERERRLDSKPEITAAGVHNGTLISMGKGTLLVDGPSVLAASLDENEPVPAPDAGAESEVMQAAGAIFNNVRGGSDEMVGEWMLVEMGMDEEDKGWIEL